MFTYNNEAMLFLLHEKPFFKDLFVVYQQMGLVNFEFRNDPTERKNKREREKTWPAKRPQAM